MKKTALTDLAFNGYLGLALALTTFSDDDALLDTVYEITDIHPSAIARSKEDCLAFVEQNQIVIDYLISDEYWSLDKIMADFLMVRSGTGISFSDRPINLALAKLLDTSASKFGNPEFYVGDDGIVYLSGSEPPLSDAIAFEGADIA